MTATSTKRGGTPQRYVSGNGSGKAGGRVSIRSTNGDIVVRRSSR